MGEYDLTYQKLELEQIPFEKLQTALYYLLRIYQDQDNIVFEREEKLPLTMSHIRIYQRPKDDVSEEHQPKYFGYIRMVKISEDVTELEIQCMVRGDKQKLFNELIQNTKIQTSIFDEISNAVIKRNKSKGLRKTKNGKPGRPSLPEDLHAWNQVRNLGLPAYEVYKEWINSEEVQKRKLQDPKRHFERFIKRKIMRTKP